MRDGRTIAARRLARLRPHRGPATDRQLLVRRLPGRPRRPARCAVARCAGGPGRPQHGRQRGDELCRRRGPQRIRRLVNMEGFGLPEAKPEQAPERLRQWLDELKTPQRLKPYASLDDVAARLIKNNPRLHRRPRHLAGAALGRAPRRRPVAHPRRPGAQAREPGAVPQRRGARGLEAHRSADAVDRRRRDRPRPLVGPPLSAQRVRRCASRWSRTCAACASRSCGHMLHFDQPQALAEALDTFLDVA